MAENAFDPDAYLAEKSPQSQVVAQSKGFDPDAYLQQKAGIEQQAEQKTPERPWYSVDAKNLVPGFFKGLENIDSVTGAPIRKFVTEKITGKEFEKAPSGVEQAKMLGATDKTYEEMWGIPKNWGGGVSPADIYGTGLEIIQDPFVIGGGLVKGAKGIKNIVKGMRNAENLKSGEVILEQSGKAFEFKAPKNLDELNNWNPEKPIGAMPGKQRLQQIESILPDIQQKPLKYHYEMMDNPKSMKALKLDFENLPTDNAKKIAAYNQEIVDESTRKIKDTVTKISGGVEPANLSDSGNQFIGAVKEQYRAEKKSLGPLFEKIQTRSKKLNQQASQDLIIGLGENTRIGKLLEQNAENGRFTLKPNSPRSGMSDSEHGVLKRLIDDLNDGMTFKEVQDSREFLRKAIDPKNPGVSSEIKQVRKIMLDQLEEMAGKISPEVRDTFKSYAKNERARESVEKIIGGSIESLDKMYSANPDKVVRKIFSNPNYVDVVGEYIGSEKMNQMVGSFINSGISKATDSARGFSPSVFKNWLKSNRQIMTKIVDKPALERLDALADYGYYGKRFLDEVNPSGTAASLKAMLEPGGFVQKLKTKGAVNAVVDEVSSKIGTNFSQKSAVKRVNEALGSSPAPTKTPFISNTDLVKAKAIGTGLGASNKNNEQKNKGPEKWANDGFDKILMHLEADQYKSKFIENKDLLINSKKGKQLLIEASNLKPNSKAMKLNVEKLKKQIESSK